MSVIVRRLLWIGVTAYSIFMGGCDCLEHFFGWVWVSVTGCGWVGKMVKPKKTNINMFCLIRLTLFNKIKQS